MAKINQKYSKKDFTNQSFTKEPAKDFSNSEIIGSNFYQELISGSLTKSIFPVGMTGAIFNRCNLDNVVVPLGNTVLPNCTNRKIRVQKDLEDWVVDNFGNPIEPVNVKKFEKRGISTDPADIPSTKLDKPLTIIQKEAGVKVEEIKVQSQKLKGK